MGHLRYSILGTNTRRHICRDEIGPNLLNRYEANPWTIDRRLSLQRDDGARRIQGGKSTGLKNRLRGIRGTHRGDPEKAGELRHAQYILFPGQSHARRWRGTEVDLRAVPCRANAARGIVLGREWIE